MHFFLGAGLSSVLLKYPNMFFDDSESRVCLFIVHSGVAKSVCSCMRTLYLLLPISEHSMLLVPIIFLFLKKKTTTKQEPSPNPQTTLKTNY